LPAKSFKSNDRKMKERNMRVGLSSKNAHRRAARNLNIFCLPFFCHAFFQKLVTVVILTANKILATQSWHYVQSQK
jgi:hypothetical protein